MIRQFIILCLIFQNLVLSAQSKMDFVWETSPTITNIPSQWKNESVVVIFSKQKKSWALSNINEPRSKNIFHKRIHILDEKGIEENNKLIIPFSKNLLIKNIKARTISPQSKITELKSTDFTETTNENGIKHINIAFENVVKGCEVEFLIELEIPFTYYGEWVVYNSEPTMVEYFELISPSEMICDIVSYNGMEIYEDTNVTSKHVYYGIQNNLKPISNESYAYVERYLPKMEYVLIDAKNGLNHFPWANAVKHISMNYYTIKSKELNEIHKLFKNENFYKLKSIEQKVLWIENYIKSNIKMVEADYSTLNVDKILKEKLTNEFGYLYLFSAFFKAADIDYELGFTCDKTKKDFDFDFYNVNNLEVPIFYIKDLNQILMPQYVISRIPFISPSITGNYAMLVTNNENISSNKARKFLIPSNAPGSSYHNHDIKIELNENNTEAIIFNSITFGGIQAVGIRPMFVFLEEDKKMEYAKELMIINDEENVIENIRWENEKLTSITEKKPFILKGEIHSSSSIEKVGKNIIFKIGELIGPQSQLYKEKTREWDIDIDAHQLFRNIELIIPKGYTVTNLKDLEFDKSLFIDGKIACYFKSNYKVEGDKLTLDIKEEYVIEHISKKYFEEFRSVINAAADFNKVSLLLKSK